MIREEKKMKKSYSMPEAEIISLKIDECIMEADADLVITNTSTDSD